MNRRITALAMAGALMGTFVLTPIAAVVAGQTDKKVVAQRPISKATALQNLPATGDLLNDSRTFEGTVSITKLGYDQVNNQLLVSGVLLGTTSSNEPVTKRFTDIPATLTEGSTQKQVGKCDILFLDIGPIFLDVLGLQVDLSQIVLNIDAVRGPGNLLGNLLCALVGLLDGGPLGRILQVIDQINTILSSL